MLCASSVYSLEVKHKFDRAKCFPQTWYKYPVRAKTLPIRQSDEMKISQSVKRFLLKYPRRVVEQHLDKVYSFRKLNFFGKDFGATYSMNRKTGRGQIYIRYNNVEFSDWKTLNVRQLHHEFSSVLMKMHRFPKHEWVSKNGGKYVSGDLGRDMLISHGRDEHNHLLKQGFLTSYGQADFENDVNIYAEYVFVFPNKLNRVEKRYPAVAKKAKIIRNFYCKINKSFFFCQ